MKKKNLLKRMLIYTTAEGLCREEHFPKGQVLTE
jgi:hypothetical protein